MTATHVIWRRTEIDDVIKCCKSRKLPRYVTALTMHGCVSRTPYDLKTQCFMKGSECQPKDQQNELIYSIKTRLPIILGEQVDANVPGPHLSLAAIRS